MKWFAPHCSQKPTTHKRALTSKRWYLHKTLLTRLYTMLVQQQSEPLHPTQSELHLHLHMSLGPHTSFYLFRGIKGMDLLHLAMQPQLKWFNVRLRLNIPCCSLQIVNKITLSSTQHIPRELWKSLLRIYSNTYTLVLRRKLLLESSEMDVVHWPWDLAERQSLLEDNFARLPGLNVLNTCDSEGSTFSTELRACERGYRNGARAFEAPN